MLGTGGKNGQGRKTLGDQFLRLGPAGGKGPGNGQQLPNPTELFAPLSGGSRHNLLLQPQPLSRGCLLVGNEQGQGHFTFPQVVAQRFAGDPWFAQVVQQVIDDLEGQTQVVPVGPQGLALLALAVGDDDSRLAGGGDQRGSFASQHRKISALAPVVVGRGIHLGKLRGDHGLDGHRHQFQTFPSAGIADQ